MTIKIKQLTKEEVFTDYSEILPELKKALDHSSGEWTPQQVIEGCVSNPANMHIWYVFDDDERVAIASTRVVQYNNFLAIHIITLGGKTNDKMGEWTEEFINILKQYPQLDCIECTGRKGLLKPLIKAGWKERYVTIRKSLKEGFDV